MGKPNINKDIDFLRYRIGIPMIQVETLGAGGGSIGWIDHMGLMQMGPKSAGSELALHVIVKAAKTPLQPMQTLYWVI